MDVEALVKRLRTTPLYYGHGEESSLPEESAEVLTALSARVAELERERVRSEPEPLILAAPPAGDEREPIAWVLTRDGDPTFPRAYGSKDVALAARAQVNAGPLPVLCPVPPTGDSR